MDIGYLKSIRSIKDKIKLSYSCNEEKCPTIKERLDRHIQEHHSNTRQSRTLDTGTQDDQSIENSGTNGLDVRDQGTTISQMGSSTEYGKEICQKPRVSFTNSVQSDFIAADMVYESHTFQIVEGTSKRNHNVDVNSAQTSQCDVVPTAHKYEKFTELPDFKDFIDDVDEKLKSQSSRESLESINLERKETMEVLTPKNVFYKVHVQEEVYKWLEYLPLCPNLKEKVQSLKKDKINALIDEIHNMHDDINEENYEKRLKFEISKCLNSLPIWTLDSERDQTSYKEKYNTDLLQRINKLNNRVDKQINLNNINIGTDYEEISIRKSKNILKNEINNWLAKIKMKNDDITEIVPSEKIVDLFLNRLSDLLDEPNNSKMYKLTLKGEIVEVLLDLPIHQQYPRNKMVHINKLAEELANGLIYVLGKLKKNKHTHDRVQRTILQETTNNILGLRYYNIDELKTDFIKVIDNVLTTNDIGSNREMEEEILDLIIENIDIIRAGNGSYIEEIVFNIICDYTDVTELQAFELAKNILIKIKDIPEEDCLNKKSSAMFIQPRLSGILSIYNTEKKFKMFTSTPKKKKKTDEDIPKLNLEQVSYLEKLSEIIRDWMKTLPVHFDKSEETEFKNIIINDLAGHLMDTIKYDQIIVGLNKFDNRFQVRDKQPTLEDIIFVWLHKYGICEDQQKCAKEITELYNRVDKIPVPILTRPQHGTRQAIAKTAWLEGENYYEDSEYIPKGINVLEDNISMWMNEQSDIFTHEDRSIRGRMVKALARDMQERLVSKHSDREIISDIGRWLNEVVKTEKKKDIPDLIEELRERIKDIPQDITLNRRYMEKMHELYLKWLAKQNPEANVSLTFDEDFADPNGSMKEYVGKFIQSNYDIEDSITRKVLSYILKKELIKLGPAGRQDVYNNSGQFGNNQMFSAEKFGDELEYIKILSDWLNTLPLDPKYKVLRNKHRIEFIHNLAKYFSEIERERADFPNAMDYDAYLMSIIASYTVYLPLHNEQRVFMLQTATSLLKKLEDYRNSAVKKYPKPMVNTDDLGILIDDFIQEHGNDVGDDPLKLEVWMDRVTEEIQNIARETVDPMMLGKTQILNKLAEVPVPGEESMVLFGLELNYAKEITDWLKNLPLKRVFNQSEEQKLVRMISDLTDKIIDRRVMKLNNTNDVQADTDIVDFIKKWIFELPLDTRHEIVVPIVIQQLMNRIDKVNKSKKPNTVDDLPPATEKSNQTKEKSIRKKSPSKSKLYQKNPESAIIDAVEKFCNALPIQANNENVVRATKDDIAKKLLEKICKLNFEPTIFNDELLFTEMFGDEIDMVLGNIPQDPKLQKNKEKLKNTLIETVVELENIIKEQSAGENYKQKLENTIEASLPNPVQMSQIYDPGFEFYKNRLAAMFILENFDQANEVVKLKYEKRLQSEVDKYFEHAQNRNAIPLSKDRLQNELYSALFKVPVPNEASLAGEVEEAKTRFEIDAWYELLPLRPTDNLDELLERDKILTALTRRIHEIEMVEKNAHPIIHKEITKWLTKLPLLPGNSQNIDELANQLQSRLKPTIKDRKCFFKEAHPEKGKGKYKAKRKSDNAVEKSPLRIDNADNVVHQSSSLEKAQLYSQMPVVPQKSPADLILEAVETWCNQLPMPSSNPREAANSRTIKDNVAINIILKISELNSDPEIFADEYAYDAMLDQEIDKQTYNLPLLCDFQSIEARKVNLKEIIRSIKPMIVVEREKHEYKEQLKNTVFSLLEESQGSDHAKKVTPPKKIVEEIVDDFLKYNYNKDNTEERNVHKIKVHDAVVKHLSDIKDKVHIEPAVKPLILRNELICEMSKVPPPSEIALKDIVEEIRMKNEVNDFFQELSFPKEYEPKMHIRNQFKDDLAKKLFNLERNGHNDANDSNMNKEISKCLNKLGKKVTPDVIDAFVQKLQNTEARRKASPSVQPRCQSFPKDIHLPVPNLQQIPPSVDQLVVNAQAVLSPKSALSFPPTHPEYNPTFTREKIELRSGLGQISGPHMVGVQDTRVHPPAPNYLRLGAGVVLHSSINQHPHNSANAEMSISRVGNLSLVRIQPTQSEIPVEVVNPGHQQASPSRQMAPMASTTLVRTQATAQQTSTRPGVIQVSSTTIPVPQAPDRLPHSAPSNIPVPHTSRGASPVQTSAPSAILLTRDNAVPVELTRRSSQNQVPSRSRRDLDSEATDDRDKHCKCSMTGKNRKKKRICIKGRNFADDFDLCRPPPLMWNGMEPPDFFFI